MVIDYIENINTYSFINKNFEKGVKFARSLFDKPVGKYECDDIFAFVQEGSTKNTDETKFESHIKYMDIQFVVEGSEILGWQNINKLTVADEYNEDSDMILYIGNGENIKISENMFYIVHEKDGHKPCTHISNQTNYKKVVLKLKI